MAENLEALPEGVDRIEHKLDALSSSVDKRFDEVSKQLVEQRQYTEFAYERLDQRTTTGFERIERRMTAGFEGVDERFGRVDKRLERVDQHFKRVDKRLERVDEHLERLERKLDQVIDGQSRTVVRRRSSRPPKKRQS